MTIALAITFLWLIIGWVSTVTACTMFRPDGTTKGEELILAASGPFFGPIITILLAWDLIKAARNVRKNYG